MGQPGETCWAGTDRTIPYHWVRGQLRQTQPRQGSCYKEKQQRGRKEQLKPHSGAAPPVNCSTRSNALQSPSPEAPHACEQRSCALPSQLGGSLSCGPLSTAGHMLCTALQTTQRFINTAQIRLFTHRGLHAPHSPATLREAASSPYPQPRPGKHHGCWTASARLLPGHLASALLPPEAIGRFTTSPSAPLSWSIPVRELPALPTPRHPHGSAGSAQDPKPRGHSPLSPQQPRSRQRRALPRPSIASRQPHARFPAGSLQLTPVTLGFWQRHRTQAAATPLPRAASQRFPEPPVPVPTAPRHPRDGTTAFAQPPPEPRAVPPAHLPPPPAAAARRPRGAAAAPRATRRTAAARAAGPWRHRHTGAVGRPPPF